MSRLGPFREISCCPLLPLLVALGCVAGGCDGTLTDLDGDGYFNDQDCDDANNTVYPGAAEVCDGLDQDCDGVVDEEVATTWYPDADSDGHGDSSSGVEMCMPISGYVLDDGDCDDDNPKVHPGAEELCNERDDDCDGETDEDGQQTFYYDGDQDGFGNTDVTVQSCSAPSGYTSESGDCDDGDETAYPGAAEVCDGIDQDCDGEIDNGVLIRWYRDADYDTYGDPTHFVEACDPPEGYVSNAEDCDDSTAGVRPFIDDLCNGRDDDCDGLVDEDSKSGWDLVSVDNAYETIWKIDSTTAVTTELVSLNIDDEEIPTMDVREDGLALVYDSKNLELHEIDVCSGTLKTIGATGAGKACGISFGPGGALYGLDRTDNTLIQIDTATGAATTVGPLGFDIGACGLSYDCQNDVLIGADATSDKIFEVDTGTGAAKNFKSTTADFTMVGIEFDAASGLLLASTGSTLYEIDPATGATNWVGAFSSSGPSTLEARINDLAYYPVCP